jgi:hypothetical protein
MSTKVSTRKVFFISLSTPLRTFQIQSVISAEHNSGYVDSRRGKWNKQSGFPPDEAWESPLVASGFLLHFMGESPKQV